MENTTSMLGGGVKHTIPEDTKKKKKIDQGSPMCSVIKKHEFTDCGVAVDITATPNNEILQVRRF